MSDRKKLVIIDGYALLFRAFYGTRFLSTSDGRPTNALFGFTSMLFTLFDTIKPDAVIVALDAPGKTFRHAEYAEYKGTRREIPQELISQLDESRNLIKCFGIPVIEEVGYEADDVVGTISQKAEYKGYETTIVTGDLDSLQLVDQMVTVMTTKRGVTDVVLYNPDAVVERYGFGPEYITDYKALVGDTSDNIPGVPGIGDKTASLLIKEFGPIEEILDRIDEVPEKFSKKIIGNEEQMKKSKWLATILRDIPVEFDFAPFQISRQQLEDCRNHLTDLEFRSHARKIDQVFSNYLTGEAPTDAPITQIGMEDIEVKFDSKSLNFDQIVQFVGSQPYSLHLHRATDQQSMFDEQSEVAYVAVGNEVRVVPQEIANQLIKLKTAGLRALDTKAHFRQIGQITETPDLDIMLAAYVLQSARSTYDLAEIANAYLEVNNPKTPEQLAASINLLQPVLTERLQKEDQFKIYQEVELPLVPILAEMERTGIKLSSDELREFSKQLQIDVEQIERKAFEIAETEFNMGSPKQIGELLFEKMQIPGGKKTKTGWATGVEILGDLAAEHEIAQLILNYRELTKLRSTYAESLPKLVASDGRIHTTFNQAVAATGRLSSIDPNLQNIPIRTELGRQIRKAFIAEEGQSLGAFDYSQIELRILAHMCEDQNLVDAFQSGIDVHTVTASLMFNESTDHVSKEHRRLAKMLNYAVLYGVTGFGLRNQLGPDFTVEESNNLIKQYNERFPRVKEFTTGMVEEARSKGFTRTLMGRRRYFPDIHAGNRITRAYAERQAMNAPIQGTAADMIKVAMLHVHKLIEGTQTKMLLQVHDELVFESSNQFAGLKDSITEKMESAISMKVPIEVDSKFGQNWMEMTPR